MTKAMITKKINKTASDMQDLIAKFKRKLLELDVMVGLSEIKQGKGEIFKSAKDLFRKLR